MIDKLDREKLNEKSAKLNNRFCFIGILKSTHTTALSIMEDSPDNQTPTVTTAPVVEEEHIKVRLRQHSSRLHADSLSYLDCS